MGIIDKIDGYINEGMSEQAAKEQIMDFLTDNPSPPDEDIHALATKLGIDTHKFEAYIYSILGSFLGNGRAKKDGFTEKDADPKELKLGIKIESEHTNDPAIAKRIAIDHLAEFSNYYTLLHKMEQDAKG